MSVIFQFDNQFKNEILNFNKNCFLFIQSSIYQKDLQINEVISLFPDAEIIKLKSQDLNLKEIRNFSVNILEISFLNPVRIFIIDGIEFLKADVTKELLNILSDIPEQTVVILTSAKIAKNNSIYSFLNKKNVVFDNDATQDKEKISFIGELLNSSGIEKYSSSLPNLILKSSEGNIDTIKDTIDYLAIYVKDKSITDKEFLKIFPIKEDISNFKLLDLIYSNQYLEYIKTLKILLKDSNEFLLLSIFSKNYTRFFQIKTLLQRKESPQNIATAVDMKDWVLKKSITIVEKYSLGQLKKILRKILECEAKLKDTNLGVLNVFEELYFALTPNIKQKK